MGKKRIAIIGDVSAEEESRKKKEIKRVQKTLREEGKLTEKQEKVKKKVSEDKKKSAKAPGLKGGERVVDTADKALEEMELQRKKERELDKLKQEAAVEAGEKEAKKKKERVRSNNYKKAKGKVDTGKLYAVDEAIGLLREIDKSKFDATVELHLNLVKEGMRFKVELPYSTGKVRKVAVADEKTVKKIKEGKIDFDVLLATAEQMPKLVPLAKVLGPKGLMPNPKNGTVVKDVKKAMEGFKGNGIEVKSEKKVPVAHMVVGKMSMKDKELVGNILAILEKVEARNVKKAVVKTTMSPGVKLAVGS
jgi:large subunit ribosomal protein L1